MAKSDNNVFYITLALIGVFGIVALVMLNKKTVISGLGSTDDDVLRKSDLDRYINSLRTKTYSDSQQAFGNSGPADLTLTSKMPSRISNRYEGREY